MPNRKVTALAHSPKGFPGAGLHWPSQPATFVITAAEEQELRKYPKFLNIVSAEDTAEALTPKTVASRTLPGPLAKPEPKPNAEGSDAVKLELANLRLDLAKALQRIGELESQATAPAPESKPKGNGK